MRLFRHPRHDAIRAADPIPRVPAPDAPTEIPCWLCGGDHRPRARDMFEPFATDEDAALRKAILHALRDRSGVLTHQDERALMFISERLGINSGALREAVRGV